MSEQKFNSFFPLKKLEEANLLEEMLDESLVSSPVVNFDSLEKLDIFCGSRWAVFINGYRFETFFHHKESSKLYVILNGSRKFNGAYREIPFFNRWSYYTFLDGSLLCVEDPMFFAFDKLFLGWFYGEKTNNNLREGLFALIEKVRSLLEVPTDELVFFSSSGGGTVAIHMSSLFEGSTCVALNPQLDISLWEDSLQFSEETGIDLKIDDPWHRNDIFYQISNASKSSFLLCINEFSKMDIAQLGAFEEKIGLKVKRGITYFNNFAIWKYSAFCSTPHSAFEVKNLFYPIVYFAKNAKNHGNAMNEESELFDLVDSFWSGAYRENLRKKEKQNNIFLIQEGNNPSVLAICDYAFQKSDNRYQYVKLFSNVIKDSLYILDVEVDSSIPYQVSLYNLTTKNTIEIITVYETRKKMYFSTYFEGAEDCTILIYNGESGNTQNNSLVIKKVSYRIIQSSKL